MAVLALLFSFSSLLSTINGGRLLDMEMATSPSVTAVCIKTRSMTSNEWLFLGETEELDSECVTKWYITPEYSHCGHPGTCVSIKSGESGLYLSGTAGELFPRLSAKEIWTLSATLSASGSRAILLENAFLDTQYFDEPHLLCSDDDHKSILFGDDGRNKDCHWMIEEIIISEPEQPCSTEHRHRKPWHSLSDEERELYISAVQKLNENGKHWSLVAVHADFDANVQAHGCSSFSSYHRYHLWEFENAVRNLGGKYKCFTLPYWDITNEVLSSRNPFNWEILHSGLGHNGVKDDEWCVNDDIFGKFGDYKPYLDCGVNDDLEPINPDDHDRQCCLKRDVCDITKRECTMFTASDIIEMISEFDTAGTDEHQLTSDHPWDQPGMTSSALSDPSPPPTAGFMYELEHKHGNFHAIIGGTGHLNNVWFSPDDPVFWLMHNFVDYIWALWQDCHDYDLVKEEDIDSAEHGHDIYGGVLAEPDGVTQLYGPSRLDDELILTELKNTDWAYVSVNNLELTPRDMHNISRWDYSFEKGAFWKNANVDEFCKNINKRWFYSE